MGQKLKEEDAKKYKIVSRILGILMRIANVCCWIGVVALAFTTIAVAVIAPNIKIDRDVKEITLFDQKINYDFKDKEITVGEGDSKVVIKNNEITVGENNSVVNIKLSDSDIAQIEKIIENDAMKIIAVLPYVLVLATISVAFSALALGHGAKVFKNIATEGSPFTTENIERSEKAVKYLIIVLAISLISGLIMSIVSGLNYSSVASGSITTILALYVVIYILKSGISLDNKKEK